MVRTIETDPDTPFGAPETPPAEWTYRFCRQDWVARGDLAVAAMLAQASEKCGRRLHSIPPFPKAQSLERTVSARVNWGRWIWDCECGQAQVCSAIDPRAFCVSCFNRGDGWWPVVWPDNQDQIETLLNRRALDSQRHWRAGETVEQLQLENLSLGIDPELPGLPWPGAADVLALISSRRAVDPAGSRQLV